MTYSGAGWATSAANELLGLPTGTMSERTLCHAVVVLSYVALEALMNDLAIAREWALGGRRPWPAKLDKLAAALAEAENRRECLEVKVNMITELCTGRRADWGSGPLQRLTTLTRLRHALVHIKPHKLGDPGLVQKVVRDVPALHALPRGAEPFAPPLVDLLRRPTAEWALKVACDAANCILDVIERAIGSDEAAVHLFSHRTAFDLSEGAAATGCDR